MTSSSAFKGYISTESDGRTNAASWGANNVMEIYLEVNGKEEMRKLIQKIDVLKPKALIYYATDSPENLNQEPCKSCYQEGLLEERPEHFIPAKVVMFQWKFQIYIEKQEPSYLQAREAIKNVRYVYFCFLIHKNNMIRKILNIVIACLLLFFLFMRDSLIKLMRGVLK